MAKHSGKSVTAKTVMKLIDMPPGKIVAGKVLWKGRDLVPLPPEDMPPPPMLPELGL